MKFTINNLLNFLRRKDVARVLVIVLTGIVLLLVAILVWLNTREATPGKTLRYISTIPTKNNDYKLDHPLGITVSQEKVYVANGQGGEIVVFDPEGDFLFKFSVKTKPKDKTSSYPVGVAVDRDGRIYVTEMNRGKLMVFGPDGHFIDNFPKDNKKLSRPLAVTYADQKLYVSDVGDQTIKVFNLDGKLLLKFGREGGRAGELSFPSGIAVGEDGTIYVADSNNRRVQIFDNKGRFKRAIRDQLSLPRGIIIDSFGRLHVADTFGRQVVVLEPDGEVISKYGQRQNVPKEQQLGFPQSIAYDADNWKYYITDRLNNRVEIWGY